MVVVGDGPLKSEYVAILKNDGTESCVKFIGEIPTHELSRYYSACDIFLMPSRRLPSDGLNVVVPEAMACGKAVVSTPVGCQGLGLTDGADVLVHAASADFAEALATVLSDPALAASLGRHARATVEQRFSWDSIAAAALASYAALLRESRP